MFSPIKIYLEELDNICPPIGNQRKAALDQLAEIINKSQTKNLIFICTHNSRRSHFAQIWMHIACRHFGIGEKVLSYSGGTEATALNPRTAEALGRAGINVQKGTGDNPLYKLRFAEDIAPIEAFSKVYSHDSNPKNHFIAIITCDEAAEACPLVTGAESRFMLRYKDPKVADDSASECATYDARCAEIAQEMRYLAARIK